MTDAVRPTPDLKELFKESATYWRQRIKEINAVADDIEKTLSDRLDPVRRESLTRKREALGDALQTLLERVRSPELILATTGTTSSGKSTLANFLIGEQVLPSAVQEMSAGLVKVRHHDHRHTLRIASTRGATWETGEWDDLSADDVRARLEATMVAFRKAEKEDTSIEPVQFEIDWPIRVAVEKSRFGLPEGTQITILDLPGLKAINDERNGPIIRENISQALCLVAYNAEETDDTKQKELLNQVIDQVMSLRKTSSALGRVLFLLNRIDAFRKDSDPEASLAKFKGYVTQQLRDGLLKKLPEEKKTIDSIEPTAISSLPALWAVEANLFRDSSKKQQDRLENIEDSFKKIFPQGYWNTYPRDLEELTDDLRRHIIADTLRYSHASEFEERLGEHIAANLPEIALAGPENAISQAANEFLTALDQTLDAHTVRTEEEAAAARRRLAEIDNVLTREADEAIKRLEELNEFPESDVDSKANPFRDVGKAAAEIGKKLGHENLLLPIRELPEDVLVRPFREISDYAIAIMEKKSPAPSPLMTGAPTLAQFIESVEKLQTSPYGNVWQKGGGFREGAEATAVTDALDKFSKQLSAITNYVVPHAAKQSADRIAIVFNECASLLIAGIEREAHKPLERELQEFPGLRTIFEGRMAFPSFKGAPVAFSSKIQSWHTTEKREVIEKRYETWWLTLWLYKHEVDVPVEKNFDVFGIYVSTFGEMFREFIAGGEVKPLIESFKIYLKGLVEIFSRDVKNRIEKGISGYRLAIDESDKNIQNRKDQEIHGLKRQKEAVRKLMSVPESMPEWSQVFTLGARSPV